MARVTIAFGAALIVLGAVSFFATGGTHPTALIPVYFGIGLLVCGFLANSPSDKRRMIVMHIAVTIGVLGFLGSGVMAILETVRAHGGPLAHPAAVESQAAMAIICVVYVGLCVRSFIAARRSRSAAA
jgi:peptidoglycan/LPS O-acetylase OafA/YrhL